MEIIISAAIIIIGYLICDYWEKKSKKEMKKNYPSARLDDHERKISE